MFVIWEPVLSTDLSAPSTDARARVPEAVQYWDPKKGTAALFQPVLSRDPDGITGKKSLVTGKVLWDFVGVYAPGVTWSAAAEPPMPAFRGAPVVDVRDALQQSLQIH